MTNKEKAHQYVTAVNEYNKTKIKKMVHKDYIQHNPFVPTGRSAFLALLSILEQHNSKIKNYVMFQDDSHIVMHHKWTNAIPFGADIMAAFHIIRFDSEGLIAEHWNVMTELSPSNLSAQPQIYENTNANHCRLTNENKNIIQNMITQLIHSNERETNFTNFFHKSFFNSLADNRGEFSYLISKIKNKTLKYIKLHRIFGDSNFVLSITEGIYANKLSAIYDLYKMESHKITKHWMIAQAIPKENLKNHNTMFNFE